MSVPFRNEHRVTAGASCEAGDEVEPLGMSDEDVISPCASGGAVLPVTGDPGLEADDAA